MYCCEILQWKNQVYIKRNKVRTFLAWQYSFSMTFPRTHGRLEVPDAKNEKHLFLIIDLK